MTADTRIDEVLPALAAKLRARGVKTLGELAAFWGKNRTPGARKRRKDLKLTASESILVTHVLVGYRTYRGLQEELLKEVDARAATDPSVETRAPADHVDWHLRMRKSLGRRATDA